MITFATIAKIDNGARFLNADLHIHSYGASSDVKDSAMTVQAIIDSAVIQGLSVIAITDHNSDQNVAPAIEYAQQYIGQLLVLPGAEITTAHGHLLVYFPPDKTTQLRSLLAKIDLRGEMGAQETHTAMSMADVILEVERLNGICIAAHIDRQKTGFEILHEGYPNWKKDIVISSGLYGVEVDDPSHFSWFSLDDDSTPPGVERKKLAVLRSQTYGLTGRPGLARVQGSDAHSMTAFSHSNPGQPWTRLKLNELTFDAVRTALIDPEARVRAKASIPRSIPRIRGMHLSGGFLDGGAFQFSDNLNCFIGGRGTGKSTAIRALGYCMGVNEDFSDFGNCPDTVIVYCEDANGVFYRYERTRGGEISVKAKEDGAITDVPVDAFRVEYYGQGELADVAKDPLKNPALFQEFLDRHITLRDLLDRETALVSRLRENASQLLPLEGSFAQLPTKYQSLADVNKKLKIAEEGKLQEIVAIQTKITSEKTLRTSVDQLCTSYHNGLSLAIMERDFDELCTIAGEMTEDAHSVATIQAMRKAVADANAYLQSSQKEINAKLKAFASTLTAHASALKVNHGLLENTLAAKIAELKGKGLTGNLAELQQLLRQKSTLANEISTVEQRKKELDTLRADRTTHLTNLQTVRDEMTQRRKNQLKTINENLARTITDYLVFVKYDDAGVVDEFVDFISGIMQGSYLQEQQVCQLCQKVSPRQLANLLRQRDVDGIARATGLGNWAAEIDRRLSYWKHIFELEVLSKQPAPRIVVRTKSLPTREIPVIQLSDGQRHTILLTIAMLAESNLPLIIDQPEDDLDNAFIFSSIVTTLRSIKERRQVIAVTHNANIAVLGDSELLCPMRRVADHGKAFACGSIDRAETKEAAQSILEGGEVAFRRRREIYGH